MSAMEPSTSEKKPTDSEGDCRRSKRFRSKVLNFWDFERIAVLDTEEGAKAAIIKDVPGEGTIVLQNQDSVHDETCTSVFPRKNSHGETMSESQPQPKSVNKSVATKASGHTTRHKNILPGFNESAVPDTLKKSDARPNGGKVNAETNSNKTGLKRSRSTKPTNNNPLLASGTSGCRTRSKKSHESNEQLCNRMPNTGSGTKFQVSGNEEVDMRELKQQGSSPVASTRKHRKMIGDKCLNDESAKSLRSSAGNSVLMPLHMNSEIIHVESESPTPKSTLEASIENTPQNGSQDISSVSPAQGAQADQSNSDAHTSSSVDAGVHNGGSFIRGENLIFHGASSSSISAAATGEYALAKGGAHGDVETYFLHLKKGYIAFVAPRDTKLFVVRGCGHCSLIGGGTPTLVNVLSKCAEINVQKGSKLLVSVDGNCPELIVCLILFDSVQE